MIDNINFVSAFKKANIISIIIFTLSVFFVFFKGLNYGIDFKGGTLIELRTDTSVQVSSIRESLKSMNLGDVNVKRFGKKGDYLIKVEQKNTDNSNIILEIKKDTHTHTKSFTLFSPKTTSPSLACSRALSLLVPSRTPHRKGCSTHPNDSRVAVCNTYLQNCTSPSTHP